MQYLHMKPPLNKPKLDAVDVTTKVHSSFVGPNHHFQ